MAAESSYTPLGNLCDSDRGITYGIVKVGEFVPAGVPVIRGGDIRNGQIVFDEAKRVTKEISDGIYSLEFISPQTTFAHSRSRF